MIVPDFWAEGRIQERKNGRQLTVRRFGWSDQSQNEAQANADVRVREAFDRIAAGEKLPRSEARTSYNGADGVPIREQVISRHGDVVITRNIYGARCLNTPDVLFVDLDFDTEADRVWGLFKRLLVMFALLALLLGAWQQSLGVLAAAAGIGLVASWPLAHLLTGLSIRRRGGPENIARGRVAGFVEKHPDWHLRVYRTPAGLRVLVMQATFDARGDEVAACFDALSADPLYVRMCHHQNCFRARLSAKPWRIGISDHIKPRPGVWPVVAAKMPARLRWIDAYERVAEGYAACTFVEALGAREQVHPKAREVQQLHDALCRADSGLPTA